MKPPLILQVANAATLTLAIALIHSESALALTFYRGQDAATGQDTYLDLDTGVSFSPGPRVNSDTAANRFDSDAAGLGTINTVTFEGLALTDVQSVNIAPGVTASWFNQGSFTIFNNPSELLGYNTTSTGNQFARVAYDDFTQAVGVTFSFATPIQAWGAYFTGIGTAFGSTVIRFNDGTLQSQDLIGASTGGISFLGFTDPGKQIASITVLQIPTSPNASFTPAAGDIFGIDDMRYVNSVPTPALLPGFIGMGIALLRRKLNLPFPFRKGRKGSGYKA